MAAIFNVVGTFEMQETSLFVLYGNVLEGVVQPGMLIRVPLNQTVSMEAPIQAVEFVDGTKHGSHVALAISMDDPGEFDIWKGLKFDGEKLVVANADGSAT